VSVDNDLSEKLHIVEESFTHQVALPLALHWDSRPHSSMSKNMPFEFDVVLGGEHASEIFVAYRASNCLWRNLISPLNPYE